MNPFRMRRSVVFVFLLLAAAASARADAPGATPAGGGDPWLDTLSALLVARYRPAGELALAWGRPPPSAAPADAGLTILQAPADLAPQILVSVRAVAADGASADHTLVLRVEHWREGGALREPAANGSPVVASLLEPRRYDALRERDALPADAIGELDFARNVPAGRLLVMRDVARRPLVRRNQPIDVSAGSGALTVTLRAIALHDAARGEPVRVRNPDSRKEFTALVTDEARASVRL